MKISTQQKCHRRRRQIIGGGAPMNKSRRRRPQIVGGGGALLYFGWATYVAQLYFRGATCIITTVSNALIDEKIRVCKFLAQLVSYCNQTLHFKEPRATCCRFVVFIAQRLLCKRSTARRQRRSACANRYSRETRVALRRTSMQHINDDWLVSR